MRQGIYLRYLREPIFFCEVYVKLKYCSTYWVAMKDIQDSHPLELAEYDISAYIQQETEFSSWVSYTIKKWDRIWGNLKSNYWQITNMYVLQGPKYTVESKQIYDENNRLDSDDTLQLRKNWYQLIYNIFQLNLRLSELFFASILQTFNFVNKQKYFIVQRFFIRKLFQLTSKNQPTFSVSACPPFSESTTMYQSQQSTIALISAYQRLYFRIIIKQSSYCLVVLRNYIIAKQSYKYQIQNVSNPF